MPRTNKKRLGLKTNRKLATEAKSIKVMKENLFCKSHEEPLQNCHTHVELTCIINEEIKHSETEIEYVLSK